MCVKKDDELCSCGDTGCDGPPKQTFNVSCSSTDGVYTGPASVTLVDQKSAAVAQKSMEAPAPLVREGCDQKMAPITPFRALPALPPSLHTSVSKPTSFQLQSSVKPADTASPSISLPPLTKTSVPETKELKVAPVIKVASSPAPKSLRNKHSTHAQGKANCQLLSLYWQRRGSHLQSQRPNRKLLRWKIK